MKNDHDPDGRRLPIKLDSTSNGEYAPLPLEPVHERARADALLRAESHRRRLKVGRRQFLMSACGAASTLLAMNQAYAAAGRRGGFFELADEAAEDPELAWWFLGGDEFIFDVQGHYVDPNGAWLKNLPPGASPLKSLPNSSCARADEPGAMSYLNCFGPEEFIKDVFLDSDTDVMVLSFIPSTADAEPLTIEEAAATAKIVEEMDGSQRLLLHGRVNPNQDGDLARMDELAERWGVSAWKTYTQFGPSGEGFFLDDDVGLAMIEKARSLGVRNIAVHKGLPFGPKSYEHSTCVDVGRVAKRFPDVNFLIYHSGFIAGAAEGPYDPDRKDGIDALVTSLLVNEVGPNANVYAELGSTWRLLMRDPDSAAHSLGKLLRYVGQRNVLWGTDSIWYGSPQDQIQAFRSFQIDKALRAEHGYPKMTRRLRARVFGKNALHVYPAARDALAGGGRLRDQVSDLRQEYREAPNPSFVTYGPKTRREFFNLRKREWGV